MKNCESCGAITENQYCDECSFAYDQMEKEAYEQEQREEMRRWEYRQELRRDAFGE